MSETVNNVRRRKDDWIEIEAKGGSDMFAIDPIQIRPGTDDDRVKISNVPAVGAEVKIADLRTALERLEGEF